MSGFNENTIMGEKPPVSSIAAQMRVDLLVNKNHQAAVLHDKPLPGVLQWAELDVETASLTFPTEDGHILDLGMKVCPQVLEHLKRSARIQVVQIRDRRVFDIYDLALLVSDETMN